MSKGFFPEKNVLLIFFTSIFLIADSWAQDEGKANDESQKITRKEWFTQTCVESYEKYGVHDLRWDEEARLAVKCAQEAWSWGKFSRDESVDKGFEHATAAVNQGCTDPFVRYIRLRFGSSMGKISEEENFSIQSVAEDMVKSNYPAIRKYFVCTATQATYGYKRRASKDLEIADKYLAEMENWGIEALKDPFIPQDQALCICSDLNSRNKDRKRDIKEVFDRYVAVLEKSRPDSSLLFLIKGDFYITYAWDARGNGYVNTVTNDGWKLFEKRLEEAERCLERAWELDPKNSVIAERMITVEMGQGKGRKRMEIWFERAMKCDPNNDAACRAKLNYLWPRWYGNSEYGDAIAFANACVEEGNPKYIVPHTWLILNLDVMNNEKEIFAQPIFWENTQKLFENYLKEYPNSIEEKSCYASWACKFEKWVIANRLFDELGDKVWVSKFDGVKKLNEMREMAKEEAKKVTRQL